MGSTGSVSELRRKILSVWSLPRKSIGVHILGGTQSVTIVEYCSRVRTMSERREERKNQETSLFGKVLAFGPQSGNTSTETPLSLTTKPLDPMLMANVPKQGALWPSMETLAHLNPFFAVYGQASSYYPLLYPPTYTTGLFTSGSGGMMPSTQALRPSASDFLATLPKPLLTPAFALPTSVYNPTGVPSGSYTPIPRIRMDGSLDRAYGEQLQRPQALPCSASPEQFGMRALATSSMTSVRAIFFFEPLLCGCVPFVSVCHAPRPSGVVGAVFPYLRPPPRPLYPLPQTHF